MFGVAGLEACVAAADAGDPFAIVFSDIRMPRMDGLRLLEAVRADERTRALPMVAVSASSLEHERRFYIAEGFEDFVGKPYGFEMIYAMLARHAGCALVAADGAESADADADDAQPANAPALPAVHPPDAVAEARRKMWLPVGAIFGHLEENANDRHEDILAAIEAGDAALASSTMEAHINDTRHTLEAWLKRR